MDLDGQWTDYVRLSKLANNSRYDQVAQAGDDAANAFLERMLLGETTTSQQATNLIGNRARRARKRRAILMAEAALQPVGTDERNRLEARDELRRFQKMCSDREWLILIFGAQGLTTGEIAHQMATPVGTIKSIVSRTRLRLAD